MADSDSPPPPDPQALSVSPLGWLVVTLATLVVLALVPPFWRSVEGFAPDRVFRVPYASSDDYWVWGRWARVAAERGDVVILGDSFVWGEFVRPEETLSAALERESPGLRCANLGVNGIHPLALEGLVRHHGAALAGRRVILHLNPLWISSPRRDISSTEVFPIHHPELVPQFALGSRLAYSATIGERVHRALECRIPVLSWSRHLRIGYWGHRDLYQWTIAHPRDLPLGAALRRVEPPAAEARQDGRSWTERGLPRLEAEWVEASLQLAAFERTVERLDSRGNDVVVIVGPINVHMLEENSRGGLEARLADFERRGWVVLSPLPSDEYGDASHPLAAGYVRIAREIARLERILAWAPRVPIPTGFRGNDDQRR